MATSMAGRSADTRLVMPVDTDTLARLHGDACAHCGRPDGLRPSSALMFTEDTDGCRYGWRVKSCPQHRGGGGS